MIFNSEPFLIFFPIVTIIYFSLPFRWRWLFLLAASYFFYSAWEPTFLFLLATSTLVDYYAALKISATDSPGLKKTFLMLSITFNLGLLGFFKYSSFLILPVGLSFYTFQSMGYTIDVYRGDIPPERHLGRYALFVSFFPQLVAGPIGRAKDLLPQFYEKKRFTYENAADGLKYMLWGFFKKIVVADSLAVYVNAVYGHPHAFSGGSMLVATYFFAFQIYGDFSGYTDIARGVAKILGFELSINFRRPYLAAGADEFWRRWHISLMNWFRDYVYIPLSRRWNAPLMLYINILIVFGLSGLWHGANWTFLIWGGLNGLLVLFSMWVRQNQSKAPSVLTHVFHIFCTFHLILLTWIFFRASSIATAVYLVKTIFKDPFSRIHILPDFGAEQFWWAGFGLLALIGFEVFQENCPVREWMARRSIILRWGIYMALLWSIIVSTLYYRSYNTAFVYFAF